MTAYGALMQCYPLTSDDLPDELWLPAPDYEDYQVSSFGRVKSFKKDKPRILKPQVIRNGYLHVSLSKAGKWKWFSIHRLVALCFIPNPSGKPQVNHLDGNKLNNHVSNLEWATDFENQRHATECGLRPSGEECFWAKLTAGQVHYVRENPLGLVRCLPSNDKCNSTRQEI